MAFIGVNFSVKRSNGLIWLQGYDLLILMKKESLNSLFVRAAKLWNPLLYFPVQHNMYSKKRQMKSIRE